MEIISQLSNPTPLKGWTSKWALWQIPVSLNMAPFIFDRGTDVSKTLATSMFSISQEVVMNTAVRSSNQGYNCTLCLNVQDVRKRYQVSRRLITVFTNSPQLYSSRSHKIPVHTLEQEVGSTYSAWLNTVTYLGLVHVGCRITDLLL